MSLIQAIKSPLPAGAPTGVATAEDMARINKHANPPLTVEQVFVFACVMATREIRRDQAWSFGDSSLQQFAKDADSGVPYLVSHEDSHVIGGRTYAGYWDMGMGESRTAVYLVRGAKMDGGYSSEVEWTTDDEIKLIQQGLRRDVSVGPAGRGNLICSICQLNYYGGDCSHYLGREYEGRLCTGTYEGLRLAELSGVYSGAVPGSLIMGASIQAMERKLAASLSSSPKFEIAPKPEAQKEQRMSEQTTAPNRMTLGAKLTGRWQRLTASLLGAEDDTTESLADGISAGVEAEIEAQVTTRLSAHPLLVALKNAKIETPEELTASLTLVEAGRRFEAKLGDELKASAVRAFGEEKAQSMADSVRSLPLEEREATVGSWNTLGDARLGVGEARTSKPTETDAKSQHAADVAYLRGAKVAKKEEK